MLVGCAQIGMVDARTEAARLAERGIALLRAANPGPLTLSGTNTWLVEERPTWVVDPGPLLHTHVRALVELVARRGGLGGVVLTHDHPDHAAAAGALLAAHPAPLAAGRGDADVILSEDLRFGPFRAVATPGHAPDHHALLVRGACFSGDAVPGEGSVFIAPHPGALAGYLDALARLRTRERIDLICPGHGPPVWAAMQRLDEIVEHRLERERALVAGLARGLRSEGQLLDAAWGDVPPALRWLAAVTLAAHVDKLDEEGLLPAGVQRPDLTRLPASAQSALRHGA
jgi:glyoxylase-like metal-dependent hydrolase (beta-lactamase superfamily II)